MEPRFQDECFFITPIGKPRTPVRRRADRVLSRIVEPASKAVGLEAVRADRLAAPGAINLAIIEHLLSARAVIADLTGLNGNVLYELGLRHAAERPVVLISQDAVESLPFDIAQLRTIIFNDRSPTSVDECRRNVEAQLKQALSRNRVTSPVTHAGVRVSRDQSFYFTGEKHSLRLRAYDAASFVNIAYGVDEQTWDYHLSRGDFEVWFSDVLDDGELAGKIAAYSARGLTPAESRDKVLRRVTRRYAVFL